MRAWGSGDETTLARLTEHVYPELRLMARRYMRNQAQGNSLQATALVHEVYLRLMDVTNVEWQARAQFFAIAAQMMRRILVDAARARGSRRRDGIPPKINLDEAAVWTPMAERSILALDEALMAGIYEAAKAVCEAHLGITGAAQEHARAALKFGNGRDVVYAAAVALGLSGEVAESQRLMADLNKRFPEDTPVQFEYVPTLSALSSIAHRAPLDAVEQLKRAVPYDFAVPGTVFFAKFGGVYPAYVRGRGYLEAGRGQEAVAEFEKVLNHRGIVLADPIGALAHLQMGRAYRISGDISRAKAAYRDFLAIWKNADVDIPVLKDARSEYGKL